MKKKICSFLSLMIIGILLCSMFPHIMVQAENTNSAITDTDQDGIPDSQDICPTLPGNLAQATNVDGCPSIGPQSVSHIIPGIFMNAPSCNMCPCPTLDYQADLRIGDIIFAILSDLTHQTIYTKSNLYYIAE